jgi:DNA polymerase-3 subunit delta'
MDDDERRQVIGMADGSPGRALMLTAGGGVELQGKLDTLLGRLPRIDYGQVHALADGMGRRKQTREAFATLADLLDGWLAAAVKRAALANSRQARTLLEARERCRHLLERGARVNLDNKQVLLGVFAAIERATQS